MIILYIKDKEGKLIEEYYLGEGIHTIGRIPENTIAIKDMKVSRKHAQLIIEGDKCFIEDLKSTAGTFVNGEKILKLEIKEGDIINIGDKILEIKKEKDKKDTNIYPLTDDKIGKLENLDPNEGPQEIILEKKVLSIGRIPECDIQLIDMKISKEHANIFFRDGFYWIEDHSVNGTYINGRKITKQKLKEDDIISIGKFKFKFKIVDIEQIKKEKEKEEEVVTKEEEYREELEKKPSIFRKIINITLFIFILGGISFLGYYYKNEILAVIDKIITKEKSNKLEIKQNSEIDDSIPVCVTTLTKKSFKSYFEEIGSIEPIESVMVIATIEAKFKKVLVKEGDFVKKGQLLAVLDSKFIEKDIEALNSKLDEAKESLEGTKNILKAAEERYKLAKDEKERIYRLYKKKVIPQREYIKAKDNYYAAKQNFAKARTDFKRIREQIKNLKARYNKLLEREKDTKIYAPITGIVEDLIAKENEYHVLSRNPIMKIVNIKEVYVVGRISQKDITKVWVGQEVVVFSSAYPDEKFIGKVAKIGTTFRPSDRTTEVKVKLKNKNLKLKPGNFVTLKFCLGVHKNVPSLPKRAIVFSNVGINKVLKYIYIVQDIKKRKYGIAKKIEIKTLYEDDEFYEIDKSILKKIDFNTFIIVEGQSNLTDNDKVEIVDIKKY